MSSKRDHHRHICAALIASMHRPKNVARPPMAAEEQPPPPPPPSPPVEDDEAALHPSTLEATGSIRSMSSSSSDITQDIQYLDVAGMPPKRAKSNSICVTPSEISPQLTPRGGRKRGASFLHVHLPDFGAASSSSTGPHSAGPHFHIPTFTITAPSSEGSAASRRLSSALHGLGAFALRRYSNTSLHRTESMVSLCFRSLTNLINDNNLGALQAFLSNKQVQVDDRDENGTTALMYACQHGSPAMVTELLAHGADPSAEDNDGWTPLHLAAKQGRTSVCLDLLNNGAKIDHQEMGSWTPLMWACYKGHEDIVALLLERGSDVNIHGSYSISALIWAAGRGFSGIVDRLLAAGARPNSSDKYGTTALVWAARKGDVASARSLLAAGALPDHVGMYSWTALLQATQGNHIEIVQMLLEHKPNVNALDKDGCTALTLACKEGYYEIAVALLNSGAYINIQDRAGDTCLIHAVKGGHRSVVEALLKKYADVDVLGKDRKTAVYNAVEKGHTGILRLLLQSNPDLELSTKEGDTALLRAVRSRNTEMVQLLLDKKAKVNVADKRGDTCLHIAMRARSKAIVEILLRNPKDSQLLYRPNRAKETPYNIDMNYPKTILGQIFGARRLNTNDDNESMLGYELYSSALADMLSEPSLSMPITVGLYARWGSGKSFLLNKLREEMKNFAREWLELGWQWNWAVTWGLWHCAVASGTVAHLAGLSWILSLAIAALVLVLLYVILLVLWYASRRYEWSWPYTVMLALSNKFNQLRLILQVVFCHPPGPQCTHSLPSQPVRFHFTDQAKSSTQEGEASVIQMIVSLSDALENQYGKLCTRLYRAFRPKPIRSTANWRLRRVCCIPNVMAFEACFLCAIVGICTLVVYLTQTFNPQESTIYKSALMGMGAMLAIAIVANLHTLSRIVTALFFSPRSHIKRSVDKQPEGFLQALRPEICLLTDMIKCLDAFTGQQTRLVVVVDALDSCEQDRVLIVLNAIHTLCSDQHSPFVIILAIDPHIISKAVEVNSKRAFTESNIGGWDYLKNMVQLPFYLQNSALRRVKIAQQTSHKKQQYLNAEDLSTSLQRSVSARRLSSASELMSSQEKLKGLGSSNSRSMRKHKISESVASSINSNLHKVGLAAGPADLNRVLLTDDYFSDVNPRSMQRLMNVLYITGRLMKAFQIEFNWYHLATWVNLTEQWPFRTSWIILHHELFEEHLDDSTSLKSIYDKVRPNIPALREIEPLMELDRDERKLEVFLGFHRTSLLVSDLKIFLPFTINLDPYIKKVIKDEQQHYTIDNDAPNHIATAKMPNAAKFYPTRPNKQPKIVPSLPPIYGGMTPSGWPNWPEQMQPTPQPPLAQTTPPIYSQLNHGELGDVRLSRLGVSGICSLIERELPKAANILTPILRRENISGKVLRHCDLSDLKGVLNLNFGDWELFKILILTLREIDMNATSNTSTAPDKERPEKEIKSSRTSHDSMKSKPSNMEKQVTLEEQMICGALQTLNEEALEDVLLGEPPTTTTVSDENDSLQLVHLTAASGGWQPTTPPTSLTASPQLPRKSDPSILKPRGSFRQSNNISKKHVSINENRFDFNTRNNSSGNLKTFDAPIIVTIEDETASNTINDDLPKIKIIENTIEDIVDVSEPNQTVETKSGKDDKLPPKRKSGRPRPSSLLFSQDDQLNTPKKEIITSRSKSVEDTCQILTDHSTKPQKQTDKEFITLIKEKIFHRSNSIEKTNSKGNDHESENESTPLMSSERSSSASSSLHVNDTGCNLEIHSPSSVSSNKDSSSSSFDDHLQVKSLKLAVGKSTSPDMHDCNNSDVTVSMDFTPSPDRYSLSETNNFNIESGENLANVFGGRSDMHDRRRRTRSSQSVTHGLLDPQPMTVLSHGVSDTSIRTNLWRQNAVEDEDDWNNPESSV